MVKLRLYVLQNSANSNVLINNLKGMLEEEFNNQYSLEIIDVFRNMDMAQNENVLATPTLIKIAPEPSVRIIGDLRDKGKVLKALGLGNRNESITS